MPKCKVSSKLRLCIKDEFPECNNFSNWMQFFSSNFSCTKYFQLLSLWNIGILWQFFFLQPLSIICTITLLPRLERWEFSSFWLYFTTYICNYPSRTFLSLSRGKPSTSSSLLLEEQSSHLSPAWGEHRNCSSGKRYLPQKSTNLICLTRASKYTPLQQGLTQRRALLRYCNKWVGRSLEVYFTPLFLMQRPLSSNKLGGLNAMSLTKRTTRGFSRRLSSSRFRSFMSWTGRVVSLLLWRCKDCKCVSLTNVDGRDSILLSQRLRARSLRRVPSSLGTDISWLPPR